MNETFMLYILTRLDAISALFVILGYGGLIVWLLTWFPLLIENKLDTYKKTMMKLLWIPIISIICSVLIPTQKDAVFIVAGTGLIEIAKSDTAQRIAGKSVLVVEQYLDKLVEKAK